MGASIPSTVTDEDLDKHVAELILKEAKQKAQQYLEHGVKAYLPDTGYAFIIFARLRYLKLVLLVADPTKGCLARISDSFRPLSAIQMSITKLSSVPRQKQLKKFELERKKRNGVRKEQGPKKPLKRSG